MQPSSQVYLGEKHGNGNFSPEIIEYEHRSRLADPARRGMLEERIEYVYEKDAGQLTLLDRSTGNTLASASVEDAGIIFPEMRYHR